MSKRSMDVATPRSLMAGYRHRMSGYDCSAEVPRYAAPADSAQHNADSHDVHLKTCSTQTANINLPACSGGCSSGHQH